jgi:hypothetical protein
MNFAGRNPAIATILIVSIALPALVVAAGAPANRDAC